MTTVRITATRAMQLAGQHIAAGQTVDAPEADAHMALRHGWAVPAQAAAPAPAPAAKKHKDEERG